VPVLLGPVGVRGDRDLPQAQPVLGRAAILQNSHLDWSAEDYLTVTWADYGYLGHLNSTL
jgi:hypothetical protein